MPKGVLAHTTSGREYPGNLTPFALITCIVAAMGGHMRISGGITSMASFLKMFIIPSSKRKHKLGHDHHHDSPPENDDQYNYCTFDIQTLTIFAFSLYLAALVASLVASKVTRKFGRRLSMVFGGLLFCAGAIINGFAKSFWLILLSRVLLGFGMGFANQSAPLYLSEMAPHKYRGALNIGFQLSVTVGILGANVLNFLSANIRGSWGWHLSLGGAIVPALIIIVGSLLLPDTPNSMIERGQFDKAIDELRKIRGVDDVSEEFDDLITASEASREVKHPWRNLLQRKYRPHLTMAITIPFFQQLTGINVIMFYGPVLFKTIGFGNNDALVCAVITGIVNVGATVVSIYGVDKWGRRLLFLEGGAQMFICQIFVTIVIALKFGVDGDPDKLPNWYAIVVVLLICIYVAGFAWSWGPLGWLVPSEIFPLEIRCAAQSINVSVNMIFTFLVAQVYLTTLCHLKFGLFLFFAFWVLVMSFFVMFFMPETKNIPIEEMVQVWEEHWYWCRFVDNGSTSRNMEMGKGRKQ